MRCLAWLAVVGWKQMLWLEGACWWQIWRWLAVARAICSAGEAGAWLLIWQWLLVVACVVVMATVGGRAWGAVGWAVMVAMVMAVEVGLVGVVGQAWLWTCQAVEFFVWQWSQLQHLERWSVVVEVVCRLLSQAVLQLAAGWLLLLYLGATCLSLTLTLQLVATSGSCWVVACCLAASASEQQEGAALIASRRLLEEALWLAQWPGLGFLLAAALQVAAEALSQRAVWLGAAAGVLLRC
jgi:hypothetical protein